MRTFPRKPSKKRTTLIDILVGIPIASVVLTPASRYRNDTDQIIATALAGALMEVSKGTQYEELCMDIIRKSVDIDRNEIIDVQLLGVTGLKETEEGDPELC